MSFIRELDINETNLVSGGCCSLFGVDGGFGLDAGFGFGFGFGCFAPSASSLGAKAGFIAAQYNLGLDLCSCAGFQSISVDLNNFCSFQNVGANYGSTHSYSDTLALYNKTVGAIQVAANAGVKVTFPPSISNSGGIG